MEILMNDSKVHTTDKYMLYSQ